MRLGDNSLRDSADSELHDPIILALPRGGVPVAFEIARTLNVPLDVLVVRKVGAPHHREFGIGAIAEGDVTVRDDAAARMVGVSIDRFESLAADERRELERRVRHYRGDRTLPDLSDREVVIVDDGLATGVTAEAAIAMVRSSGARRVVLAAPVSAADTAAATGGGRRGRVHQGAHTIQGRRRVVRRLRADERQRSRRSARAGPSNLNH